MVNPFLQTLLFFGCAIIVLKLTSPTGTNALKVKVFEKKQETTDEVIQKQGFPVQSHEIVTEDDYILTFFRIPHGKYQHNKSRRGKPVVLLMHGLFFNSYSWFFQNEDKTLPFQLAEEGFDVWVGNNRGSIFSSGHKYLDEEDSPDYWDFSWEDMGYYDLPAAIDYILEITREPSLVYIGYSQGNTQAFVFLTLRPEYNAKINLLIGYAPAVYQKYLQGAGKAVAVSTLPAGYVLTNARFQDYPSTSYGSKFLPSEAVDFLKRVSPLTCSEQLKQLKICQNLLFLLTGINEDQTNHTKMVNLMIPEPISRSCIQHYGQGALLGDFLRFDYFLPTRNLEEYGSIRPPPFNLKLLTSPVVLFWSKNDIFGHPKDIRRLMNELGNNLIYSQEIEYKKFNHMDYIFAINASEYLYKPTIRFLKTFLTNSLTPPPPVPKTRKPKIPKTASSFTETEVNEWMDRIGLSFAMN